MRVFYSDSACFVKEKQVTRTNNDTNNTTNDHTKNHPPSPSNNRRWRGDGAYHLPRNTLTASMYWPLHDIVITNIVWCLAYQREVEGGRILSNSRAIVLQQCGPCRRVGRMKGRLTCAHTTQSKTIFCKGQSMYVFMSCTG